MHTFKLNIGSLSNPIKGGGFIEVHPLVDENGLSKTRDSKYFGVVRKKIRKELEFKGREFEAIKTLMLSSIVNVELKIYLNSVEKFHGYLILDGNFDENRRECSLVTTPIDVYSDLLNKLDVEVNIVSYATNTIALRRYSRVQKVTLPCYAGNRSEAKRVYDPDGNLSDDPESSSPDWNYYLDDGLESGCGVGEFAYKFEGLHADFAAPGYTPSVIFSNLWLKAGRIGETFDTTLNRAARLFDVLKAAIFKADPTVNINQSTYSDYINDPNNNIYNLFIMDKSDVKRNSSSNPATYEYITLEELLEIYRYWFNLSWKIDENKNFYLIRNGNFTEVDYDVNPQYDLITYNGIKLTNNQNKYKTNFANKFSSETLKFEDQIDSYFNKSTLNYNLYFTNPTEWAYQKFNNNVEYLITDPEDAQDEGMTVITADAGNIIIERVNLDGNGQINGGMSAQGIIYDHLRENRPFNIGELDGHEVDLERENDKAVSYSNVPILDIDGLDFDYYIKSSIGLCEITELEIDFNGKFGKLDLLIDKMFATSKLFRLDGYLFSVSLNTICSQADPPVPVVVYSTSEIYGKGTLYEDEAGTIIARLGYYKSGLRYYYFNGLLLKPEGTCAP